MSDADRKIDHVALVREQRLRVRDLSGFRKTHKVPEECNERTQSFVGKISYAEISEDLDERFAEFRKHFNFRRVDLQVTEPENGIGAIETPWFEYRITVTHSTDDASEAVWRRQVTQFRKAESLLSAEFEAAFGNLFDTVEFQPPVPLDVADFIDRLEDRAKDDLQVEYDRSSTWCQLTTERIPGYLYVTTDCIALVTPQPDLPSRLLEAFFEYRESLKRIECL